MSNRNNKTSVRSYFEDILNAGDLDVVDRIFSADVVFHYPLGELNGLDAVRQYVGVVRTAFPDIRFTIEDLCRRRPGGLPVDTERNANRGVSR
jgi:predicted ester cyclase